MGEPGTVGREEGVLQGLEAQQDPGEQLARTRRERQRERRMVR